MDEAAAVIGLVGIIIAIIYGVFILLIPIFLYNIQKWTYRSYLELRKINEHLLHLPSINKRLTGLARHIMESTNKL